MFVGQSSPLCSSTVCFQSCRMSFHIFNFFPGVFEPTSSRPSVPQCSHFRHFVSSLLLMCQFDLFCLMNVDV